jgi:hypothetical protein
MMRLIGLIKGWPGKPSHPPLTDASIGAYSIGVAMLVLGALGVQEEQMAHGSLLAIGGGLALALPTEGVLRTVNRSRWARARVTRSTAAEDEQLVWPGVRSSVRSSSAESPASAWRGGLQHVGQLLLAKSQWQHEVDAVRTPV